MPCTCLRQAGLKQKQRLQNLGKIIMEKDSYQEIIGVVGKK